MQDRIERCRSQFPGERILLADVVGAQQAQVRRKLCFRTMAESRTRAANHAALSCGKRQGCVPGNFAKRQDDALAAEEEPFGIEKVSAPGDFFRGWFVARRGTAGGGADVAIGKLQAI